MNGSSTPQTVHIALKGTTRVSHDAHLVTLRGNTPEETNSISDPERLVPVSSTVHNVAPSFDHTIPSYSIQVLDIEAH